MASEKKVFDAGVERAEIIKVWQEGVEGEKNKDIEGAMIFYGEDVSVLAPGMKLMKGRKDLEGFYKTLFESLVGMENEVIDIQFSDNGDMAYMICSYHMVLQEDEGTSDEIGKFLAVLTKKTGEWKTIAIAYNEDPNE